MNKFNRLQIFGLITLVSVTLIAGSSLAFGAGQAQTEIPLANLALQPQDLSKGALWRGAGTVDAADMSQPLNRLNVENLSSNSMPDTASLLTYEDAYKVEAVELDESGSGVAAVGNYLYRYPDSAQAQAAANAFVAALLQVDRGTLLVDHVQAEKGDRLDQRIALVGSAGTAISWFAGVNGRTLTLLMVEGLPSPTTQAVFDDLVARLLSRQKP